MTLSAATARREEVEAMFDRISPRYDFMNRLMTLGIDRLWRRQAIARLGLVSGERIVDLACGTGDLAEEAAGAGAAVVAIDLSAGMLREARARGLAGSSLVRADAARLPLPDASCDAVVSGFALRNFVDLDAVFAECARVLRPGGRLALLEVDTPAHPLLRLGHRVYFNRIVPLLGRLLADRAAYSYLPSSVVHLPNERRLSAMLGSAGFSRLAKMRLLGGVAQLVTGCRDGGRRG
jgi:demethylmenaquinone methyltransferase/2-methoxy-6-polyprenyl-1,4-benzoquinol methylase